MKKNKISREEREKNRKQYENAYSGDLASFTGMYGDSFYHKIDLLGQLIHDNHHPSLGVYKEKLLIEAIKKYLPKKYELGTGFVPFPHQKVEIVNEKILYGHLVSNQLDIIIYDSFDYPPIFKDGDFVVLRPESVRVIIEVKGSINIRQLTSSLEKFWDYSEKWSSYKWSQFESITGSNVKIPQPQFMMMAWMKSVNRSGISNINGKIARRKIVEFYNEKINQSQGYILPHLDSLLIYNDCIIEARYGEGGYGYYTGQGKYKIIDQDGNIKLSGDKTIGTILNKIYKSISIPQNSSFEYIESGYTVNERSHEYEGFEPLKGLNSSPFYLDL